MPPPGDYTLTPVEHDPWAEAQTHQALRPNPAAPIVNFGKLFAKTMADRAISAVTAPRDALYGTMQVTDPETGMPTQEAMQRGQGVANLAMTGGIPFAKAGAAGMAGGKLTQPEGITAYHGSPHDFDRFDLSKIGTGEGAQAYGHGLYFAENPEVAKQYRDLLSTRGGAMNDPASRAQFWSSDLGGRDAAITHLKGVLRQAERNPKNFDAADLDITRKSIDYLKSGGELSPKGGHTYQVAIKAPPEHFLDWDKPLSEQSPKVRDAVSRLNFLPGTPKELGTVTGREIHNSLVGSDEKATAALREAGIPGIRYRDQGSRQSSQAEIDQLRKDIARWKQGNASAEDLKPHEDKLAELMRKDANPTHNYVVFDDKLIDILKKYGIAGLAALPAAGGYHFRTQEVDHDPFGQ